MQLKNDLNDYFFFFFINKLIYNRCCFSEVVQWFLFCNLLILTYFSLLVTLADENFIICFNIFPLKSIFWQK